MAPTTVLYPNLGAEEGARWRRALTLPAVGPVARRWRALFGPTATVHPDAAGLLDDFEPEEEGGRFGWLDDHTGLVPWLSTPEARAAAADAGLGYGAADPEIVRRVHDKGFVVHHQPSELDGLVHALGADALASIDQSIARIEATVASWPDWTGGAFTVKPRWGTSGRGRVQGHDGRLDDNGRRSLRGLAARGGGVLEPWLDRREDLSVQLYVARSGEVEVLATLRLLVTPSGIPVGHAGVSEPDGTIRSGTGWDGPLIAAASLVAEQAADIGFFGPCGVDALVFELDGEPVLRPVVELNARFTAATGALSRLRSTGHVGPWTYRSAEDRLVLGTHPGKPSTG